MAFPEQIVENIVIQLVRPELVMTNSKRCATLDVRK